MRKKKGKENKKRINKKTKDKQRKGKKKEKKRGGRRNKEEKEKRKEVKKRRENRKEKKKKKEERRGEKIENCPLRTMVIKGRLTRLCTLTSLMSLCRVVCRAKDRVVQPINILPAVHYSFPVQ